MNEAFRSEEMKQARREDRREKEERPSTANLAGVAAAGPEDFDSNRQPAAPLLAPDFVQGLRSRWETIQTKFIDEPRGAVQQADELVASAIKQIAERFAGARNSLERQWDRGDQVNTEELRVALTRYRSFFHKLMSV
jgi:hypothetical protein